MELKLIVNADDFGLDSPATDAIVWLATHHLLTSTTIMANFASPNEIDRIKATNISTGLHLNLIEGKPLCSFEKIPSLVGSDGMFLTWDKLLKGFISGKVKNSDIEMEIETQFEWLKSNGISISHADSHKHIHQYPVLGPFILHVFSKLGIKCVRNCSPFYWQHKRMLTLKAFSQTTNKNLSAFSHTDGLLSYALIIGENAPNKIRKAFEKYNCLELMTHPALSNIKQGSYFDRKNEFESLKTLIPELKEMMPNLRLINYSELSA